MQSIATATLLLTVGQVAAFIPNGPALGLKEQESAGVPLATAMHARTGTFARTTGAIDSAAVARGLCLRTRGGLLLCFSNGTPTWRYEIDDLIKAASPWGSSVEAEIIATDLLKVGRVL